MDQGINFYERFARLEEAIRSDARFLENETDHIDEGFVLQRGAGH
jgi:hypothetical protein